MSTDFGSDRAENWSVYSALGRTLRGSLTPSDDQLHSVLHCVLQMLREVVVPMALPWCRNGGTLPAGFNEDLDVELVHTFGWGLACFGVGAEQALGYLSHDEGLDCFGRLLQGYAARLVSLLSMLGDASGVVQVITRDNGDVAEGSFYICAVTLYDMGCESARDLARKDGAFLEAVLGYAREE